MDGVGKLLYTNAGAPTMTLTGDATTPNLQSAALEPGKTVDLRVEGYAYVR